MERLFMGLHTPQDKLIALHRYFGETKCNCGKEASTLLWHHTNDLKMSIGKFVCEECKTRDIQARKDFLKSEKRKSDSNHE